MSGMKKRHVGRTVIILTAVVLFVALLAFGVGAAYIYVRNIIRAPYSEITPIEDRTDDYSVDVNEPPDVVELLDSQGTDASDADPSGAPDTADPEAGMIDVSSDPKDTADTVEDPAADTASDTGVNIDPIETAESGDYVGNIPIYRVEQKRDDVLNVLFVGRDEGTYYGRADSAMVVSYNSTTGNVRIVSLLRDSYVPIEGHNWNKLGHALSYGGMGLYINTVNYVLDLDIQKYIIADFEGVKHIVDTVGGVDIELSQDEADYYKDKWSGGAKAGVNHLDGDKALAFARNRSLSGTDFARAERQRKILLAVGEKLKTMQPSKALKVVQTMLQYVKTNIPVNELLGLASTLIPKADSIKVYNTQMPFEGTWSYAYVKPPGYTGNMAVTKIDIPANREAIDKYLYE